MYGNHISQCVHIAICRPAQYHLFIKLQVYNTHVVIETYETNMQITLCAHSNSMPCAIQNKFQQNTAYVLMMKSILKVKNTK